MIDFKKLIKDNVRDYGIPIQAEFVREIGEYSDNHKDYLNRRIFKKYKNIFVNICEDDGGRLLLKFTGGPTGYECYLLQDILDDMNRWKDNKCDTFCICGGTINRWDACYVSRKEVYNFIKEVMGE